VTRAHATRAWRLAVAAAALVLLTGCAAPTATGPAAPGSSTRPSPSSASSTPTPTSPSATRSTATPPAAAPDQTATAAPVTTPDPRRSPNPAAAPSTQPYPQGRAGTPFGGLPAASTRTSPDPLVVAAAALRVLYGSDTTLDAQPMDAEKRALPWLGGPFAAAVRAAAIVAAPGAVWNGWAAHRAHLVVTLTRGYDDGAPPTTPSAAYQQWVITQTPVGTRSDGTRWTGTPVQTIVLVDLTRPAGRWQLTRLHEEN